MVASLFLVLFSIVGAFREETCAIGLCININTLVIIGSVLVLVISLIEWRVRWKVKADRYGEAYRSYCQIKFELVKILTDLSNVTDSDVQKINERYESIMHRTVPIPERKFIKLKQAHLRKVYISRILSRYPFAWKWPVRLRARFKHSLGALNHEE